MFETINEKVSVITVYDREKKIVMPVKIRWQGRNYKIIKTNYYHRYRAGRDMLHVFHVTDGSIDFRLKFDSQNLIWTLEEVSDGSAN
jgi:hypothetical protein